MHIVLYSTNCPKCKQLERMLDKVGLSYEICTDIECMVALGMREAPALQVGKTLMNFANAWKWLKEQEKAKNEVAE